MKEVIEKEHLKIFEDDSNHSDQYLRNRIRKSIVPILKSEGLNPRKLYDNFHNKEDDYVSNEFPKQIEPPSFLKIDKRSIEKTSLGNLKQVLDANANILKIHPFTKNILLELKKEIEKNNAFLIQNKEVYLWKSQTSDLFIIPLRSPALQKPQILEKENQLILNWNGKEKTISHDFQVGFWEERLKIKRNNMHKEISELFRVQQIPLPIRKCIPILFKENQPCIIFLSLWDDNKKDFLGD